MKDKVLYIKKGYRIEVTSWENDADNYKTKTIGGLSKEYAEFLVDAVLLCQSKNSYPRNPESVKFLGNMNDGDSLSNEQVNAIIEVFNKHRETLIKMDNTYKDDIYNIIDNYAPLNESDSIKEIFSEAVSNLLGYSEYYDFRVTDNVQVYYVEEDIYLEKTFEFAR